MSIRIARHAALQTLHVACLAILCAVLVGMQANSRLHAQESESSDAAIAAYADAANFQTNGAIDLAIQAWRDFLKKYPSDPMSPKAAHYLGVCHMQQEQPDYEAASKAFELALRSSRYELREQSLFNYGWCLYTSAGSSDTSAQPQRDQPQLKASIAAFQKLRTEFPESKFLDQIYFYSGEASFGMGDAAKAIEFYNAMLALASAKDSPLRCDALYARGVAYEQLNQSDAAVASFKQMLDNCDRRELVTDVYLRMGDTAISRQDFSGAITLFEQALKLGERDEDLSYALVRQASAYAQANQPAEAAARYERLLAEFPSSPHTRTATLASAQSIYRSGQPDEAAKRFERVLQLGDPDASTEASHWLARIYLSQGDFERAKKVAKRQLEGDPQGKFVAALKLDYAEALSMDPSMLKESLEAFKKAYRDAPDDPLASRALYNAAFSSMQLEEPEQGIELSSEFLKRFSGDVLAPDVKSVLAECKLMTGQTEEAADLMIELATQADPKQSVQRPRWLIRAAMVNNYAGRPDQTVGLLKGQIASLPEKNQQAEAQLMLGQALMMTGQPSEAAAAFTASHAAAPQWPRAEEALLLSGQALFAAGKVEDAKIVWEQMVASNPETRMADQARFKLGQLASNEDDFEAAQQRYEEIIASKKDLGLLPYAYFYLARLLLDNGRHQEALESLQAMLRDYPQHPLAPDALLARGICHRKLGNLTPAREDLSNYLDGSPSGLNLGNALYELALVDQTEKQPEKAAERLTRIVEEVPDFPAIESVMYELGWSLREAGKQELAVKTFVKFLDASSDTSLTSEVAYFVGQSHYDQQQWDQASTFYQRAANDAQDADLSEKSLYRLGWSRFKAEQFDLAEKAFQQQATKHPDRSLAIDALMMVGECRFSQAKFDQALDAYRVARQQIQDRNETAKSLRDPVDRQSRELTLLHGGQSAAQLKNWQEAIEWYDELRERFPSTPFLAQVFYESGFAHQELGNEEKALAMYGEVADNFRNEVAARARFMMGEIHFSNRRLDQAIPEFQRVMFGFGADKAAENIKNWQAKSAFEAGRCSEILMQQARTESAKKKSLDFAAQFFQYVITQHPNHELAEKSRSQLEALKKK